MKEINWKRKIVEKLKRDEEYRKRKEEEQK